MASAYHDRMPVILSGQAVDRWLDPSAKDMAALTELLKAAPSRRVTREEYQRKRREFEARRARLM